MKNMGINKHPGVPWNAAIMQSLAAVPVLAGTLTLVESVARTGVIIALGATTFVIFATPHAAIAQPRRVIGGYAVGIASGLLCYYLLGISRSSPDVLVWIAGGLAVGLSILLMTLTRTGHPPAASTALCVIIEAWSFQTIGLVLLGAVCLAAAGRLLRNHLVDLV